MRIPMPVDSVEIFHVLCAGAPKPLDCNGTDRNIHHSRPGKTVEHAIEARKVVFIIWLKRAAGKILTGDVGIQVALSATQDQKN